MKNQQHYSLAPPLDTVAWLNSAQPLTLAGLRGKVVVIHAFQMLCPGCVAHGIPQASAIDELYRQQDVQVIGLHTVFEHHDVMTQDALSAFVHEYNIQFPIAIDRPADIGPIPHTMANYQMQGTPTLIILDKKGYIRLNHLGRISDMQVGNIIGRLLAENNNSASPS
jgi:peroxiredoxin